MIRRQRTYTQNADACSLNNEDLGEYIQYPDVGQTGVLHPRFGEVERANECSLDVADIEVHVNELADDDPAVLC